MPLCVRQVQPVAMSDVEMETETKAAEAAAGPSSKPAKVLAGSGLIIGFFGTGFCFVLSCQVSCVVMPVQGPTFGGLRRVL
jgi:hypothetical protein